MSSKSTHTKKSKKTLHEPQTRKTRPLSPGAATFDALNNPAYDTSKKHFSPPIPPPVPVMRPYINPEPRLQNLGITGPAPVRRTQSLDSVALLDDTSDFQSPLKRPIPVRPKSTSLVEEIESFDQFDDFGSVPAPDEPLKGGRGHMYPALKNYLKRSKRNSKKKSKKNSKKKSNKKSKRKSKKNSKKNSKKKSKKARR